MSNEKALPARIDADGSKSWYVNGKQVAEPAAASRLPSLPPVRRGFRSGSSTGKRKG